MRKLAIGRKAIIVPTVYLKEDREKIWEEAALAELREIRQNLCDHPRSKYPKPHRIFGHIAERIALRDLMESEGYVDPAVQAAADAEYVEEERRKYVLRLSSPNGRSTPSLERGWTGRSAVG